MKKFVIEDKASGIYFEVKYTTSINCKNINLRVGSKGVRVSSNKHADFSKVYDFVWMKRNWVHSYLQQLESRYSVMQDVEKGNVVYVLGNKLPLIVERGRCNCVTVSTDKVVVTVTSDKCNVADMLLQWYRTNGIVERIFARCVAKCGFVYNPPFMNLRLSKNRLGTCFPAQNRIVLNLLLSAGSEQCIETVCMHELCHLKHSGHNKNFYTLLKKLQPDYKKYQQQAKEFYPLYYNAIRQFKGN